ncbi:GNAT family N-acetyltransferase [Streptomyces sp. SAJ15]|uniref:GNAT family N-acetyltransferase n=1 Tax=Streptomyces sp. SAJ15 TaxID=2011095 RepID=UPI00118473DB|nr:GNAT family N-acetyltransferase [Streptomyces sp. SAJ15]TVL92891.1 GNAT family N-acetyltransferase [Streptomyces sp. SAJ15]
MTSLDFRTVPDAHLDRALDLAYLVFHDKVEEEKRKTHLDFMRRCERVGAYDGEQLVGLLGALPLRLSVPGGELPCAGVTFVCVAPTHRRRGVLTGMIDELWRRCARAGQPIAALWVSEASIYGRFGFDPATRSFTVEIDSARPLALRVDADERPLRFVDAEAMPALLGPFHDGRRALRAGRMARDEHWWREELMNPDNQEDDGFGPPRTVVIGGDGGTDPDAVAGYAIYRTRGGDDSAGTPGTVDVYDVEAESAPVAAALWRYLASIDLTEKVRAWGRPLDDPLLLFAADRDQVRVVQEFPALWLRLVDVSAALRARGWAADVDLVLELSDARLPANAGRFRLTVTADGDGVTYEATDDAPDLGLDVRELAACYLGGTRLAHLVRAGLATEHTPGAAERLDAALHTEWLPHTTDEF